MFGPREIMVVLVVLLIVLLVFGPKRIKSLGSELGNAIKGFRSAVRDKEASGEAEAAGAVPHAATDAEPSAGVREGQKPSAGGASSGAGATRE